MKSILPGEYSVRLLFLLFLLPAVARAGETTIPTTFGYWNKQYAGAWYETAEGLQVNGTGYRSGNESSSKSTYNFANSEVFIKWKPNGNGTYMWLSPFIGGTYFNLTTNNTWNGSLVLAQNTWYYTHLTSTNGSYTAVISTGNYNTSGGTTFTSQSGTISSGDIKINFGDNYGSTGAYMVVGEVRIVGVPDAPTGLAAQAGDGQVTLTWNPVAGATSYNLYMKTASGVHKHNYTSQHVGVTSPYVRTGLTNGTPYYFVVVAVNGVGESSDSNAISATPVANTPPVATAQTVAGNEDADLTITLSGTDADGQTLSARISTLPVNGSLYQTADGVTRGAQITVAPTTVTDAGKRVIYAPPANGNGAGHGNFGFKVNDGSVDSPEAAVTVNVTPVNDAPTLSAVTNPAAILEDAGAQTINLSGMGTGASNETQVLSVTATSNNTALIPNPTLTYTSPNATGSLSYTLVANANGTATIMVTVTDDGGTANGGVNTVSRTFDVTVGAVNDAPTLAAITNPAAILEGAGQQTISLSGIGSGAANESQTLTVSATSSNTALIASFTINYTSPNTSSSLSYTPVSQASGSATITVTVADDGGTANGGVNTFSQSFTVVVNPVNTVSDFGMSHPNPVRAGEGFELSVSFRNAFGRAVPYTGAVRLEVPLIELGGEGVQQVSNASAVLLALQAPLFRTVDGATETFPFTLSVEGVGNRTGAFQIRSRYLIPVLSLPLVEVQSGAGWVAFGQYGFGGGRRERLRLRNPNGVRARTYLDLSYLRPAEGGQQTPAVLYQMDTYLEAGVSRELEVNLPLYLDIPGGGSSLRLWCQVADGPALTLADGEAVRYADTIPPGFAEAPFTPARAVPAVVGSDDAPHRYGDLLTCGLVFEGENTPRTLYTFDARQANGVAGGHHFTHDLQVGVEDGRLQVVRDGRLSWLDPGRVNQVQVLTPEAAAIPLHLSLGPLTWVYPLQVAALPNALPQAQILRVEVWRPAAGNGPSPGWIESSQALSTSPVRLLVQAEDPDPEPGGGIVLVGVMVGPEVVAPPPVEGHPARVEVWVELPQALRQGLKGEVVFLPFAVDGRQGRSEVSQTPEYPVLFDRKLAGVEYLPWEEGDTVFRFEGPRPGSQYVAVGLRVQKGKPHGRVVEVDQARVEVVWEDGSRVPPESYELVGTTMQEQRQEDGRMAVFAKGSWDARSKTRTRWLSRYTQIGLGPPSLGVYVSPAGEQRVDYLFPYVVEVLPAAKLAPLSGEVLEELRAVMAELAGELPAVETLELHPWDTGARQAAEVLPGATQLWPNYPNPFNPLTQIVFELAEEGGVQLGIYNLLGQEVRRLVDEYRLPGAYRVEWDGRDEAGQAVGSGVYVCRLHQEGFQQVKKMLLVR